ncbi:MAG: DUF2079 domain-containing protein [Myxococcales bacterium]|nr:DUF2079 domain-containing protein [Myxococcales bacterium]
MLVFGAMGYLRYRSVHNQTFDLAFYARMAHGLARGDFYDPIMGAHVLGLHASPVLVPLGWLGMLVGTVPVLLLAQTLSAGLAAQRLAQMGARTLGPWGALAGLAFALHPNLSHVLSYEFHPGTLALGPLVWTLDALDRRDARGLLWATVAVLLCREDLAAITALTGVVAWLVWTPTDAPADSGLVGAQPARRARRVAAGVALGSLLWLGLWIGFIIPAYTPRGGSLDLHFGHLGGGFVSAILSVFTQPLAVAAHITQPEKLSLLPRVLAPLLGLSLLAPRRLLPALPVFAMLLLSQFPTTSELRTHYLTPALPVLVWSAVHGLAWLRQKLSARSERPLAALVLTAVLAGYVAGGCGPLSLRFYRPYYVAGDDTLAAREVLAQIPGDAAVQAPDALLPHLAERATLHRAPPPERHVDYWVLDVSHRARYAGQGTLLRTAEEPFVRAFMAREDRGVRVYAPPYVLLERGYDPRAALAAFRDDVGPAGERTAPEAEAPAQQLTACLSVTHASRPPGATPPSASSQAPASPEPGPPVGSVAAAPVRLHFVVHGPCPTDLALRVGTHQRPRRVELLFGGAASPALLRAGDHVFTDVADLLPAGAAPGTQVYVGALRSSGARPEPGDPITLPVSLRAH